MPLKTTQRARRFPSLTLKLFPASPSIPPDTSAHGAQTPPFGQHSMLVPRFAYTVGPFEVSPSFSPACLNPSLPLKIQLNSRVAWRPQGVHSVEHPTLGFSLGGDLLRGCEVEPHLRLHIQPRVCLRPPLSRSLAPRSLPVPPFGLLF